MTMSNVLSLSRLICRSRAGVIFLPIHSLYNASRIILLHYIKRSIRCPYVTYVRNGGRGQLSSE